ncbi:Ig-like domain-containing protein [Streptomyces sp. RS10V-4]|uniref:L,D-transpeptidase family protein n=1 Tax=Streptomyces rhizoryzae TaxID=2932493 RepID=UPI002006A4F9|nr:Ig-like domain-containing protein [Streptomyces rhizoryzae]MCK7625520.1 Ig-like domain-containing protein [Streptomyces rhizoryzae]
MHAGTRRPTTRLIPAALAAGLLMTACGTGASQSQAPAAKVTVTPVAGSSAAKLGAPISVKADGGRLTAVDVKDDKGAAVPGRLAADGSSWTSQGKVRPATTYTVHTKATSSGGKESAATAKFTTEQAGKVNKLTNTPGNGQTVGTGMPVSILFDHPVAKSSRAEIEKALKVTTQPHVEGAWGWVKDWSGKDRIDWRPKDYWPSGTKVSVRGALSGINSGDDRWFVRDYDFDFSIGADHKAVIDVPAHTLTMYADGKPVGTIRGSAGSPQDPTRGGVHTVRSKNAAETMDSATIGHGNEWMLDSQWVTHLTASGTFLHSAPWNKSLGVVNNSHGCFGMTTSDAKRVYDFLSVGSTVEVKGTTSTKKTDVGNGLEVWQETWSQWQQRSALK